MQLWSLKGQLAGTEDLIGINWLKKEMRFYNKGRECDDAFEELKEAHYGWSQEKQGQELEVILKGWA